MMGFNYCLFVDFMDDDILLFLIGSVDVSLVYDWLMFLFNNGGVLFVDNWLMVFMYMLFIDNWLMMLMNDFLMMFMENVFLVFYNHILVVLVDHILMDFFNNRCSNVCSDIGGELVSFNGLTFIGFLVDCGLVVSDYNWFFVDLLNNHLTFMVATAAIASTSTVMRVGFSADSV